MPQKPPEFENTSPLSWKQRLVLIGFGLFLTAICLEVGLRIAHRFANPALKEGWNIGQVHSNQYWAIYDPDLGYRQNPNFADLNSDGLRDHPIGPKDDRFRVLLLGDSLAVYGDTVDDTFVGHLRTELSKNSAAQDVQVIDAGIKGYTNYQEVLYLKKYGLEFQPDLVGFAFCLNDLFKYLQSFKVEDGHLVPGTYSFSTEAVQQDKESGWRRLAKKSALVVWLYDKIPVAAKTAEWRARQGFSFDYRVDVHTAWQDQPWLDIERQLAQAVALGHEHGFEVFMVAFPLQVQYDAEYLARDRDYVLKPQRKLKEICERLGITFYDLYPDMQASDFGEDGMHLTPAGRQRSGRRIAAFLMQSGLLQERPSKSDPN